MGTFKMDVGTVYSQPGKPQDRALIKNIIAANIVCVVFDLPCKSPFQIFCQFALNWQWIKFKKKLLLAVSLID